MITATISETDGKVPAERTPEPSNLFYIIKSVIKCHLRVYSNLQRWYYHKFCHSSKYASVLLTSVSARIPCYWHTLSIWASECYLVFNVHHASVISYRVLNHTSSSLCLKADNINTHVVSENLALFLPHPYFPWGVLTFIGVLLWYPASLSNQLGTSPSCRTLMCSLGK